MRISDWSSDVCSSDLPIAVNVVYEGDRSVDTFAANVTQEDLAGLTDPDFNGTPNLDGAPAGFGSDLLNLNFDTFNGQFTGNHHIFSPGDLDDTNSQNDWPTKKTPPEDRKSTRLNSSH